MRLHNDLTDRIHRAKTDKSLERLDTAGRLLLGMALVYAITVLAIIAFGC